MKVYKLISTILVAFITVNSVLLPASLYSANAAEESTILDLDTKIINKALLGDTVSVEMTLKNISSTRLYNASVEVNLPVGTYYVKALKSSDINENLYEPTYKGLSHEDGYNTKMIWGYVKDLLPGDTLTIHAQFRMEGEPVFYIGDELKLNVKGYAYNGPVDLNKADEIEKEVTTKIEPLRLTIDESDKDVVIGETNVQTRELEVKNNPEVDSNGSVTITETLDQGIEYISDSQSVDDKSGTINYDFSSAKSEDGKTTLQWTISQLTRNQFATPLKILYNFIIGYNKGAGVVAENEKLKVENKVSGEYVGRPSVDSVTGEELPTILAVSVQNIDTYTAKYISLNKQSNKNTLNPGDEVVYTLEIQTSEYYEYANLEITDILPDGISYLSVVGSQFPNPQSSISNPDGTTTLTWNLENLEAGSKYEIKYKAKVNETYHDNSPVLSNDSLNNTVSLEGQWNDTSTNNRNGDSSESDTDYNKTPKVETKTFVLNTRTGEWVDKIRINKGYDFTLKLITEVPEHVPTQNLNIKFFYPEYVALHSDTIEVIVDGNTSEQILTNELNGIKYLNLRLGNAEKGTTVSIVVNGTVNDDEALKNGTILRTLTRVSYTNHNENETQEADQGTLEIFQPAGSITLQEGAKYTIQDLIRKNIKVRVPDSSLENYVRYKYCSIEQPADININPNCKEASWGEWIKLTNDDLAFSSDGKTLPDYVKDGNKDGLKTICIQVEDQLENVSSQRCDSIILDTKAPIGRIVINPLSSSDKVGAVSSETPIVNLRINEDMANVEYEPVEYSVSTDGQVWSEWTGFEAEVTLANINLNISSGIAQAFVRFKDKAGNVSSIFSDTIEINLPPASGTQIPDYGINFFPDNTISNLISLYTLTNTPEKVYSGSTFTLKFDVQNTGKHVWYSAKGGQALQAPDLNSQISNPVNISYHWINSDTNEIYQWEGNRAYLSRKVELNEFYTGVNLQVRAPEVSGNYTLILDAVHEGVTWFSQKNANTYEIDFSVEQIPGSEVNTPVQDGTLPDYHGNDNFGHGVDPDGSVLGDNTGNVYSLIRCTVNVNTALRFAPDSATYIVKNLQIGDIVYAFGRLDLGPWIQVKASENKIGFVESNNLICEGDVSQLPIVDANQFPYRQKAHLCDTRFAALRAEPYWTASIVKIFFLKNEFYVLEEIPADKGSTWLQIMTTDGVVGWLLDSFVCVDNSGQNYNWTDYEDLNRPYTDPSQDPGGNYYDVPITSDFGERNGTFHTGVDYGLYCGTAIYAAASGKVLYTFTEGIVEGNESTPSTPANYVVIEHRAGDDSLFQTRYWHLDEVYVQPGQEVVRGEVIGTSGNTGYVRGLESSSYEEKGCHLHFETHKINSDGTTYPIDPELLLQYGEIDSPVILGLSEIGDWGYGGVEIDYSKLRPVYRFWSDRLSSHFYTMSEGERNDVVNLYPDEVWRYEGVAFYAYPEKVNGTVPVYRFWSDEHEAHFYTISEKEKQEVMDKYDDHIWRYENIAFYTYPNNFATGSSPVYRFWSGVYGNHFYTINRKERDHVIKTWPDVWGYEGEAFHAVPESTYVVYAKRQLDIIDYGAFTKYGGQVYCGTYKYYLKLVLFNKEIFIGDVYYNPYIGKEFLITHDEYYRAAYYDDLDGECALLGWPREEKRVAAKSPFGTTGTYQMFQNGGIYHNNRFDSTWAVYGEIFKKYEYKNSSNDYPGTRGSYGFPVSGVFWESSQKMDCQIFEGGWLCEYNWVECNINEYMDGNRQCVKDWDKVCKDIGMEKYINPNDANDVTCAKINNSTYINQSLDSSQNVSPVDGWMMCGANAAVMALSQQGIITETDYDELRKYVYEKDGISISDFRRCPNSPNMSNIKGAYSYTAIPSSINSDYNCNINGWDFIASYLKGATGINGYRVEIMKVTPTSGDYEYIENWSKQDKMNKIKEVIDVGGGIIQGQYGPTLDGHINLIIGYTDDNLDGIPDRFIVNDSYTNLMRSSGSWVYDFTGKGSIYDYGNPYGVAFTRILIFRRKL